LTSQRLLGVGIRLKYFNIIRYTSHKFWNASTVEGSGQGVHGAAAIRAENRLMREYSRGGEGTLDPSVGIRVPPRV